MRLTREQLDRLLRTAQLSKGAGVMLDADLLEELLLDLIACRERSDTPESGWGTIPPA